MRTKFSSSVFKIIFSLFVAFLLSGSPAFADEQGYAFKNFHTDLTIAKDSSVTVIETIDVEFLHKRHGFYRDIPYKVTDDSGTEHVASITVLSVTDGSSGGYTRGGYTYRTRIKDGMLRIQIGDKDKLIIGEKRFMISYLVNNVILYYDDHDELYWNATGNQWKWPIPAASATITGEFDRVVANPMTRCFTGALRSKEMSCDASSNPKGATFAATRELGAGEGLTVAFGFDKGLIHPPTAFQKFLWKLDPSVNWVFIIPFFVFFIMFILWYFKGRDPDGGSVVVQYNPPQMGGVPMSAADLGVIIDETLDTRDINAAIVGLASKGYVSIEEIEGQGILFKSKDFFLKKLKGPDAGALTEFEITLLDGLFGSTGTGTKISDLKNNFYTNIPKLTKLAYGALVSNGFFRTSPDETRAVYTVAAVAIAALIAAVGIFLTPDNGTRYSIAGAITFLPIFLFGRYMPAKTFRGAKALAQVRGFQEFLNRAEKDKLERMNDKDLFSKYLPYAIALDVVDNWAKSFDGIFQNPPSWYQSSTPYGAFSPYSFSRSFNSATASLASALTAAPRGTGGGTGSGGFGGGGFSGGGFGGGGGGDW